MPKKKKEKGNNKKTYLCKAKQFQKSFMIQKRYKKKKESVRNNKSLQIKKVKKSRILIEFYQLIGSKSLYVKQDPPLGIEP